MNLGQADYRDAAMQRIEDARRLRAASRLSGAVYLAGRAVESMLRALIRLRENNLETGHDLKALGARIRDLGLLRTGGKDEDFVEAVQEVGRIWMNNMRFAGDRQLERRWKQLGVFQKRSAPRTLKEGADVFLERCYRILERCELLWQRSLYMKSRKS